jgi:hypothetical protein
MGPILPHRARPPTPDRAGSANDDFTRDRITRLGDGRVALAASAPAAVAVADLAAG